MMVTVLMTMFPFSLMTMLLDGFGTYQVCTLVSTAPESYLI